MTAYSAPTFWTEQFMLLDDALPRYSSKGVRDWNKVRDHYRASGFPASFGETVAHHYHNYRSGQVSFENAIRELVADLKKHEKK